jgi:hypothetical protein
MNNQIKIDKFELTKSEPNLKLSEELEMYFVRRNTLKIDLIEVEGIENPSDLILVLKVEGQTTTTTPFYFYKYRTKFIFQNGLFILDTSELEVLQLQLGGTIIDIKVIANEIIDKYKVTLYYTA